MSPVSAKHTSNTSICSPQTHGNQKQWRHTMVWYGKPCSLITIVQQFLTFPSQLSIPSTINIEEQTVRMRIRIICDLIIPFVERNVQPKCQMYWIWNPINDNYMLAMFAVPSLNSESLDRAGGFSSLSWVSVSSLWHRLRVKVLLKALYKLWKGPVSLYISDQSVLFDHIRPDRPLSISIKASSADRIQRPL